MKTSLVLHQQCKPATSVVLRRIRLHRTKKKVIYSGHLYRIVKQIPQEANKSCWAVDAIHLLNKPHLYGKVALEAARLSYYKKKLLVTSSEVHAAAKVVLLVEGIKSNLEDAILAMNKCIDASEERKGLILSNLPAEMQLCHQGRASSCYVGEKRKSEDQIETDGSPGKKQRLNGPALYHGRYGLSDLEDYAAKNQDQLIKQLEDYLEPNTMSTLKELLAHSQLKNSFVFTAKQCYALYTNQKLKKFRKKISNAEKSQNIPEIILSTLFSTIKSNNKRRAMDQKQRKDNSNLHLLQERPQRENQPTTSSPAGSPAESEPKNQWNKLPASKGKENTLVPLNASCLGLNDHDGEKKMPKFVYKKPDGDDLQSSEIPVCVGESQSIESQVPKEENGLHDEAVGKRCSSKKEEEDNFDHFDGGEHENYAKMPNANCHDKDGEEKTLEPVYEKTDEDDLQSSEIPVCVGESQSSESQVPEADNRLCDEAIKKWCKRRKVENCLFDYIGVREHGKYACFVAQDVIRFRFPGDTKYGLLRILQDKNDLTRARKLKNNVESELQFNMAVLDAARAEAVSPVSDFLQVVPFDNSFTKFEEFLKDVVHNIVLPILALFKMVQIEHLQMTFDKHRYSINE
ncbi:uncharacterized protein [Tiliqua scincoides]|uniref:uncharacterized protein n=1 Tax=Tiliqua scincoides TaxID=71010 RepID=UPI0034627D94